MTINHKGTKVTKGFTKKTVVKRHWITEGHFTIQEELFVRSFVPVVDFVVNVKLDHGRAYHENESSSRARSSPSCPSWTS